jgi:hypothetical protein
LQNIHNQLIVKIFVATAMFFCQNIWWFKKLVVTLRVLLFIAHIGRRSDEAENESLHDGGKDCCERCG